MNLNKIKPFQVQLATVDELTSFLKIKCHLDFTNYNKKFLRRRLVSRLNSLNIDDFQEYKEVLRTDSAELRALLHNLTINVSELMRNPETFAFIENKLLPRIIKEKKQTGSRRMYIWSAGCASGEEPYSMAIILVDKFNKNGMHYKIYATDIDEKALTHAKEGVFHKKKLQNLSKHRLKKFFDSCPDKKYKIRDNLLKNVIIRFKRRNIINDLSAEKFDLIICRNVSIYFNIDMQREMYEIFYNSLREGGYFIIGKTEIIHPNLRHSFETINSKERVYRKLAG